MAVRNAPQAGLARTRTLFATPLYDADLGDPALLADLAHSIRTLAADDGAGKRWSRDKGYKGYTSYEYFAYDHQISRSQFGRYEKGQDLKFSSLIKVVNASGISLSEFFSEGFD